MSSNELKKLIISTVVVLVFIGLITLVTISDVDLGIFKISSIKTVMSQHDLVMDSSSKLDEQKKMYGTSLTSMQSATADFEKEKAQYESISDNTINIIKEATTQEKYSIEYIWIKLGNYAKRSNLAITLAEPGGKMEVSVANTETETNQADQNSSSQQAASSDGATATETDANKATANTQQSGSDVLMIQVVGNYINVSDFIFEIENDKELRFKLDNITMEYDGNNNIKARFNIKKLVVTK